MLHNPLDSRRLQEIYSHTAAFYDEVVAEHQAAAKLQAIELLNRQPGELFLEVALGTGWAFTRVLKASGTERAYGLEVAPGMLDVARQRLRAEHDAFPSLMLGDAIRLPFRDACLDCLLCTYTLECLPEERIREALSEALRLLRPEGRFVVADLTEGEGEDAAITEEWKRGFERDPEFYGGARPLRLVPMLEAGGFSIIERKYSGHGASWPTEIILARPVRARA